MHVEQGGGTLLPRTGAKSHHLWGREETPPAQHPQQLKVRVWLQRKNAEKTAYLPSPGTQSKANYLTLDQTLRTTPFHYEEPGNEKLPTAGYLRRGRGMRVIQTLHIQAPETVEQEH